MMKQKNLLFTKKTPLLTGKSLIVKKPDSEYKSLIMKKILILKNNSDFEKKTCF